MYCTLAASGAKIRVHYLYKVTNISFSFTLHGFSLSFVSILQLPCVIPGALCYIPKGVIL